MPKARKPVRKTPAQRISDQIVRNIEQGVLMGECFVVMRAAADKMRLGAELLAAVGLQKHAAYLIKHAAMMDEMVTDKEIAAGKAMPF